MTPVGWNCYSLERSDLKEKPLKKSGSPGKTRLRTTNCYYENNSILYKFRSLQLHDEGWDTEVNNVHIICNHENVAGHPDIFFLISILLLTLLILQSWGKMSFELLIEFIFLTKLHFDSKQGFAQIFVKQGTINDHLTKSELQDTHGCILFGQHVHTCFGKNH